MRRLRLGRNRSITATPAKPEAQKPNNAVKSAVSDVLGNTPAAVANNPKPITPDLSSLSPRQLAFVDAYCELKNVRQAAIKAGYAKSGAAQNGGRLIKLAPVQREINRRRAIAAEAAIDHVQVRENYVLSRLVQIADWDIGDFLDENGGFVNLKKLTKAQRYGIREVVIEEFKDGRSDRRQVRRMRVKMEPKTPALELLGRHLKMFDGDQKPMRDAASLLGAILREIDHDARSSRAKVIDHAPQEPAE